LFIRATFANLCVHPQPRAIGTTAIWVLPNPSGLNAHFTSRDLAAIS
jgi:TDG/mug DNA glycosylase family protein